MKNFYGDTDKMPANTQRILKKIQDSSDIKEKRKYIFRLSRLLEKESADEIKKRIRCSTNIIEIEECHFQLWCKELDRSLENLLDIVHNCADERKVGEAILYIGDEKYFEATNVLISLLSSPNSFIRNTAALSLGKIPSPKILFPIIKSIKDNPNNCESLVCPLWEIDCTEAIELLVDLFIKKETAPLFRINVIRCFEKESVKSLTSEIKEKCCKKIKIAINSKNTQSSIEELEMLYEYMDKTPVAE